MSINKKKVATTATALGLAGLMLFGGTYAWQSISQTALNEASDVINPGGRLHDDFNGENKDVYVENFAEENIYARIRLDEYFEIVQKVGSTEKVHTIAGSKDSEGNIDGWSTHYFDQTNATDEYWDWLTGGSTVFVPTFNKNKDSLVADINGTYYGPDNTITDLEEDDRYTDYKEYTEGETVDGEEIYDADTNDYDEVGNDFENLTTYVDAENIVVETATHEAKETLTAELISMDEWETVYGSQPGDYWVYDTDGWVYWANPIKPGEATGLLLDGISLDNVMDDSWYYAINVVAQFITADDLGKEDGTGFYDTTAGTEPTDKALALLEAIGVDVSGEASEDEDDYEEKTISVTMTVDNYTEAVDYTFSYSNHSLKNRFYQVNGTLDDVDNATMTYTFGDHWDYQLEEGTDENAGWTVAVSSDEHNSVPAGVELAKINNTTGEIVILCEDPQPDCHSFFVNVTAESEGYQYEKDLYIKLYSTDFSFEIIPEQSWYVPGSSTIQIDFTSSVNYLGVDQDVTNVTNWQIIGNVSDETQITDNGDGTATLFVHSSETENLTITADYPLDWAGATDGNNTAQAIIENGPPIGSMTVYDDNNTYLDAKYTPGQPNAINLKVYFFPEYTGTVQPIENAYTGLPAEVLSKDVVYTLIEYTEDFSSYDPVTIEGVELVQNPDDLSMVTVNIDETVTGNLRIQCASGNGGYICFYDIVEQ